MIETRGLPSCGAVASLAGLREPQRNVVRIRSLLIIGQMTPRATRGRPFEFPSDVAGQAIQCGVRTGQREARHFQVIEFSPKPVVLAVTLFARRGKTCAYVGRRGRRLKVFRVAGITLRRHRCVLRGGNPFVAGVAVQCSMCTQQREAVLVLLNFPHRNLPAFYAVTLLAVRA